jgi:hypothetical protein
MGMLINDFLVGSTKSDMQTWIRILPMTSTGIGTKTQLVDQMMTWAQQSAGNNALMTETVLSCRTHKFIKFLTRSNGGKPCNQKMCSITEFIRLDTEFTARVHHRVHSLDADAAAAAGAGGACGAGACGVLVPLDTDGPKKRRKLRRTLTKLWGHLARRRLRSQRSRTIITELHWCVRTMNWTLTLIKQHVADKSGVSMDRGHY